LVGYACAAAFTPLKATTPAIQLLANNLKVIFIVVSIYFLTESDYDFTPA
jgi:hypothetical protein